ncbi:MAG: FMN-dependent NADH-azoreductase [Dokdonella sp.]
MNLLHVDSSALGTYSVSRELSGAIVDAWMRTHPRTQVTYRDVAAQPLAHWTPATDGSDPSVRVGAEVLEEFLAADVIVIGAPMYNFSIPSTLKAWIDRVAVAGKTFRYGANGPEGLAGGKRVILASSRGGFYGAGTPRAAFDFQEAYLRQVFGFLGVTDIEILRAEGVALGAEQKAQAIASAHAAIRANERLAA